MGIFSNLFDRPRNQIDPAKIKVANTKSLKALSISVPDHLPTLEFQEELNPKNSKSVARRCAVLSQIIGIGFGAETSELNDALVAYNLIEYASENEKDMLGRDAVTKQEKIDAEWLVDCMQSFAWCFGLADLKPLQCCDDDLASCFPSPHKDPASFINEARLRPFNEIYAQADFHYRLHWAVRNARPNQAANQVSESIVRERRRALDWVIGVESNWDDVPSDT